jgi:GNAT superfamily N-acetyltransferase
MRLMRRVTDGGARLLLRGELVVARSTVALTLPGRERSLSAPPGEPPNRAQTRSLRGNGSQKVTLREAEAPDAAQIAELFTELGHPLAPDVASERLTRGVETVFVAANRSNLVGLVVVMRQLLFGRARPNARITALVVRSSARRTGVGRILVARAREWARSAGCDGIEVTSGIRREREAAHHFYENLGLNRMPYRYWLPLKERASSLGRPRQSRETRTASSRVQSETRPNLPEFVPHRGSAGEPFATFWSTCLDEELSQ